LLSPAAREIQYLREIGRVRHGARRMLAALRRDLGLALSDLPFPVVAARARAW